MAVQETERRAAADWAPTARVAGAVAGAGIALQTALFLLDAVVLPESPPFTETGAGRDRDLAAFYTAFFERQHDVLWDIALRDTVGPAAGIALVVLVRALVAVRAPDSPAARAWALVVSVGAVLKVLADLTYLSLLGWWRGTGFIADPPADMIAIGRVADAVDHLSGYLELTSDLVLAVGMVALAPLMGGRLPLVARTLAVALLAVVVTALGGWSVPYAVATLLTGLVLAPVLLIGLGRSPAERTQRGPGRPAGAPLAG